MTDASVRGVDLRGMARLNAVHVLRVLRAGGTQTLTELMNGTGLARRTTELAIERLAGHGLVVEVEPAEDARSVGRPPRSFRFDAQSGLIAGVSVDSRTVHARVADLNGELLGSDTRSIPADAERDARVRALAQALRLAVRRTGRPIGSVVAVTVASPGLIVDSRTITRCDVITDWSGFDLAAAVEHRLGVPVRVENDTNLAAVAERWLGVAAGRDNLAWVRVGRRSRAALVVHGIPVGGADGAAGEIGWQPGVGWELLAENPLSRLNSSDAERAASARRLLEAAEAGEAEAAASLDAFVDALVPGLAALTLTLNPELIVLGGAGRHLAPATLRRIESGVAERTFGTPHIVASTLAEDAAAIGALRLSLDAAEERLFDPARFM